MTAQPMIQTERRTSTSISQRSVALTAGLAMLVLTLLSSFADFGVLQSLVVPADAAATVENIAASPALFRIAIAAFLLVALLNMLVAWALYVLLRPVDETLALLVGWLRLAAPAVFAIALANLLDVARLLGGAASEALQPAQLQAQVMTSIAAFDNGWAISLAIFGLHLGGLGYLLLRSAHFPRFLGVLVIVAGGGHLADAFAAVLAPDFAFTPSPVTFFGQAWLTLWLIWRGFRGSLQFQRLGEELTEERAAKPTTAAL